MNWAERLTLYEKLMRLDKPIGILLLLWPTLWGIWIAWGGRPNLIVLWIFVLGTALMRSAGCVVNDYADRNFDPHVQRTKDRPIAAGKVSGTEAWLLAGVLALAAFLMVLRLNALVIGLSFVALFLAITYPFTKRFFALPQAYLGLCFAFGVPMAFASFDNSVPALGWTLFAATFFWIVAYDTEYAMTDREDDLRIGIKTSAITFGRFDVAAVMACHLAFLGILTWIGVDQRFGRWYFLGLLAALALVAWQFLTIRRREPGQCFRAFLHNNWVGAAVFAGIVLDYGFPA